MFARSAVRARLEAAAALRQKCEAFHHPLKVLFPVERLPDEFKIYAMLLDVRR